MTNTQIRLTGIVSILFLLVVINSYCTQFVAGRLAYHSSLGAPLFSKFYEPFAWWQWMFKFHDYAQTTFAYAFLIFFGGWIACMLALKVLVGFTSRSSRKHEGSHGTAHFASKEEIIETGLLPRDPSIAREGVYCGGFDDESGRTQYLRHDGMEHVLVIAPTGSGKGVGLIIPTLLSWLKSVFILDIKGENYAITSGWRKEDAVNTVFRFDPATRGDSCAWNPLEEIRFGSFYQVSDTQNVALMIIDDDGKGIAGNHWRTAAFELLSGAILHALYKAEYVGRTPCIMDCAHMLTGVGDFSATEPKTLDENKKAKSLESLFKEMMGVELDPTIEGQEAQLFIRAAGKNMSSKPEKELDSIISTANNALSLYRDPTVGGNTSHSDFKISDLMDDDKPMSLYFIVDPDNLLRLRPLMRLLLTRIIVGLTGKMKFDAGRGKTNHKHDLLLMLDEFPSLGKLDVFESALAFIRGYGIKAYIITQDVQQLYQTYTQYQSITSNCHIRIAFAPTELKTAEMLSKMTGITTITTEQISNSGKRFGLVAGQFSSSYHSGQRPLMTPDEIQRLPLTTQNKNGKTIPGNMLVFVAGSPVILARQTPYFLDPTFDRRSRIAPPKTSDVLRKKESIS